MEDDNHSFVVRIWYERVDNDGKPTVWRGSIEHVSSGKRLHFYKLESVVCFIQEQARLNLERSKYHWLSLTRQLKQEITKGYARLWHKCSH